jgi:hypothetical protein
MIVVDASALTNVVVYTGALGDNTRKALIRDTEWIAPEHLHAETFSAVRGLRLLPGGVGQLKRARRVRRIR